MTFAERALAIFERETDPQGPFVAHALWVIGVSRSNLGQFDRAISALERARKNREVPNALPAELAEVHFALGRTLLDAGVRRGSGEWSSSCARGPSIQQAPRTTFVEADLRELDRWLARAADRAAHPAVSGARLR